jgi:outer membrane autotransporter protein
MRLGASFAYARANVDGNSSIAPNSANIDVYQLVGYGSHSLDAEIEVSFQLGLGQNKNRGKRSLLFAGMVADSRFSSLTATAGAGLGRVMRLNEKTSLSPSVRADYTWINDKGYTETGAGAFNLVVNGRTTDELILAADTKLNHEISPGTTLAANFGAGYDVLSKRASITAAYVGAPGAAFTTQGLDSSPWLARGGLGLTTTAGGAEITARYDAEYRKDFLNQTASVKLRWVF